MSESKRGLHRVTESFANGWTNPYRYDGRDGVRYDASDGFYWMSVSAYDPMLGRFIAHDPLGRAPLFFSDNPYVYAGNNPVSNVDPSGERYTMGNGGGAPKQKHYSPKKIRTKTRRGTPKKRSRVGPSVGPSTCPSNTLVPCLLAGQDVALTAINDILGTMGWPGLLTGITGGLASAPSLAQVFAKILATAVATRIFASIAVAGVVYELIMAFALSVFVWQAFQPEAYWMSASKLQSKFSTVEALTLILGIAVGSLAASLALENPALIWLMGSVIVGVIAGVPTAMYKVGYWIDKEELELGYPVSV